MAFIGLMQNPKWFLRIKMGVLVLNERVDRSPVMTF